MKKVVFIFFLLSLFISCEKGEEILNYDKNLNGQWKVTSLNKMEYNRDYVLKFNEGYFKAFLEKNTYQGQVENYKKKIKFYLVAQNSKKKLSNTGRLVLSSIYHANQYKLNENKLILKGYTYNLKLKRKH